MVKHFIIAALLVPALAHADVRTQTKHELLTVDGMLAKINSTYMQGMQRCYVKALSQDASLEGQVTIVFTVNPWGRVSGTAAGIAPKVDSCLTSQLASWRFPSPRDGKDKPSSATFKINLNLTQQ